MSIYDNLALCALPHVSKQYLTNTSKILFVLYKGTEVYICLTTLHGDGGAGVFFESFCFVGGKQ